MTASAAPSTPGPTRRHWVGLGVLSAALGLIVLDGTIVGVALPAIIDGLAARGFRFEVLTPSSPPVRFRPS